MKPSGLKYLRITDNKGLVTNIDTASLKEDFALRSRGFRHFRPGMIAERDYGTIHRFPAYPSGISMVNSYTLYDPKTDEEHEVVVGVDVNGSTHIYVHVSGSTWKELTRRMDTLLESIVGTTIHVGEVIRENGEPINGDGRLDADQINGWIVHNSGTQIAPKDHVAIVTDSWDDADPGHRGSFTIDANVASFSPAWANKDVLVFYEFYGRFCELQFDPAQGTSPHVRFSPVEAQRKVNILLGSSDTVPVMTIPTRVEYQEERPRFYNRSNVPLVTYPEGWCLDRALNLTAEFISHSNRTTPVLAVGTTYNTEVNGWLKVTQAATAYQQQPAPASQFYNWYVVTVVHGYQESDPVYEMCAYDNTRMTGIFTNWQFHVNPGRMPRSVTGLRIYLAQYWFEEPDNPTVMAGLALGSEADLKLHAEIPFDSWAPTVNGQMLDITTQNESEGRYIVARLTTDSFATPAGESLIDNLGHYPDYHRSLLKPRFIARAGRGQGAIHVIDEDDWTLRISSYSGYGVHMDDNFPDVEVDRRNFKQRANLMSRGRMLGLGVANAKIYTIKSNELEVFDPITSEQDFFPCDAIATKGIVMFPGGVAYCGTSGIYLIPNQGIGVGRSFDYRTHPGGANIAIPILNWYNGTLLTAAGVPYVTDEYRRGIVAGYDEYYRELWFCMKANTDAGGTEYVCLRFNVDSAIWGSRVLNLTNEPLWFGSRADKTFTVGTRTGLFKYPNMTGFCFEDEVAYNGDTAGRGIQSSMVLNLSQLADLAVDSVLYGLILEYVGGSLDKMGKVSWTMYRDANLSRSIDTGSIRIDVKEGYLLIDATTGGWNNAQLQLDIPAEINMQRFDLSSIMVAVTQHDRKGFE